MLQKVTPAAIKVHSDRYSTVAIAFHWLIAGSIVLQLALGWHMGDLTGLGRSVLLQIHKSVGISILLLTLGRMLWRMVNPPPPHGSNLTRIERIASHWVHMGFYAALLLLPLTGWAMVSLERASRPSMTHTRMSCVWSKTPVRVSCRAPGSAEANGKPGQVSPPKIFMPPARSSETMAQPVSGSSSRAA